MLNIGSSSARIENQRLLLVNATKLNPKMSEDTIVTRLQVCSQNNGKQLLINRLNSVPANEEIDYPTLFQYRSQRWSQRLET
jgi:hypothetical protein